MFDHGRRTREARHERTAFDPELCAELVAMVASEQALETELRASGALTRTQTAVEHPDGARLSATHAERIWELLDDLEAWPGVRRVGHDGARAAWQIVMRAQGDLELQRRVAEHLEIAIEFGDAEPHQLAMLEDRIAMAEGRPQRYGTQLIVGADGASLEAWPIEEPERLESRRRLVGLGTLAEQLAKANAAFE